MKFELADKYARITGILDIENLKKRLAESGKVNASFTSFSKVTPLGLVEAKLTWGHDSVTVEVTKTPVFVSKNRVYMEIKALVDKEAQGG